MPHTVPDTLGTRFPKIRPVLAHTRRSIFADSWFVGLPPDALWPHLADTSRVNRSLGVPRATFREVEGHRRGRSTYFGVDVHWDEPPWEWVQHQHFVLTKDYDRGPIQCLGVVVQLEPDHQRGMPGTRLSVLYAFVPRGLLGRLLCPQMVRYTRQGYRTLVDAMKTWAASGASPEHSPFHRPRRQQSRSEHLAHIARQLVRAGFSDALVDRFVHWVLTADPLDLTRIRVRPLAAAWGLSWPQLLQLSLEATRAGLLTLTWDVVCPHCRGIRLESPRLAGIPTQQSCEVCRATFDTTAPGAIELTFRVHPGVREVQPRLYCSSDAATKPHVAVQLTLAPGTWRDVCPPLREGRYLARTGDFTVRRPIEVRRGTADALALSATTPPPALQRAQVAPGSWLTFHNESDAPVRWVLEALTREGDHVAPADVLSLVRYRDLLGDDAVPAGLSLQMGNQTLLFADVVGSTELYHRLGDHSAFRMITRHVERVSEAVREAEGVVVKTMGDTVMAAFAVPRQAVLAAKAIRDDAQADPEAAPVRISLHHGPCLAVNHDTGLDYFGCTVNVAARLLRVVGPGEIGVSSELAQVAGIRGRPVSMRVDERWREAQILDYGSRPSATR
ncbi:MAG: adenylate/guanylate cyclase domain-containing protein [Myxococcales bacterium]|nr:adenylate/guanylate cyclase domain-containing protein [Myxococcales bacterium]